MKDFIFRNGRKCPQIETKVMLIDDDEDDQLIFLNTMERINPHLKCVTAWNGMEALEQLSRMKTMPEAIFLDLNMPRMSGEQFLDAFAETTNAGRIPVIVMTTSADIRTVEISLGKGASHYIIKPNKDAEWLEALKPILGTQKITAKNGQLKRQV